MIILILALVMSSSSIILGVAAYEERQDAKKHFRPSPVFRRNGYDYPPIPDDSWKLALASSAFAVAAVYLWSLV